MDKSTIDCAEIDRIAKASALELTEQLKERLRGDLSKMDELFHSMDDIEVCPRKQTDYRDSACNDLRDDTEQASAKKNKGHCYEHYDESTGYFTVPKVINNEPTS